MSSLLAFGRGGAAFRRGLFAGAVLGATTHFACHDNDEGGGSSTIGYQTPPAADTGECPDLLGSDTPTPTGTFTPSVTPIPATSASPVIRPDHRSGGGRRRGITDALPALA